MRGSTEAVLAAFFSGSHLTTPGGPTYSETLRIGHRALDGMPVLLSKSGREGGSSRWDTTVCVLFPEACFVTHLTEVRLGSVTRYRLRSHANAWYDGRAPRDALGRAPRKLYWYVDAQDLTSKPCSLLLINYAE